MRRHLRRKVPCNDINENTQTGTVSITLSEQNHVFDEHNTIYNKQNTVLSEQNATDTNKCQHCRDLGLEYFEGDCKLIMKTVSVNLCIFVFDAVL